MVVPPRSSHSPGIVIVRHDVVVVRELFVADCAFSALFNNVAVLEQGPTARRVAGAWIGSVLDSDSSEIRLAAVPACTGVELGFGFVPDPLRDFEVDFLAASLADLAAASICSFALFRVEDNPKWVSTNSTNCLGSCSSSSFAVPVTVNGVVRAVSSFCWLDFQGFGMTLTQTSSSLTRDKVRINTRCDNNGINS